MPLYVYECEVCKWVIKHVTTSAPFDKYSSQCPTCNQVKVFNFVRAGNKEQDWFSNILINNRRRRDGDQLYKTKPKRKDSETKVPLQKVS